MTTTSTQNQTLLKVNEIFLSLQGESTYSGRPCAFIRLTGCPLRCSWCDTAYAFVEGRDETVESVLARVDAYGVGLVEVTGGEPLAQEGAYPLMESLLGRGYQVLLETGGSVDLGRVPPSVVKIMDVKCPGSGEEAGNLWSNLRVLVPGQDEVKFVIRDRADYEYAKDVLSGRGLAGKFTVLFSPVHDELAASELAEWIIRDRLPVKFQVQLHKVLWPTDHQGR